MNEEIKPGKADEKSHGQCGNAELLFFQKQSSCHGKGRRCVPRREGIAAGRRDEQLDFRLLKGAGTGNDSFDNFIVQKPDQRQGNGGCNADSACFFEAKQNQTEDDPKNSAVAGGGDGLHDRGKCIANNMLLNPIKDGKIKVGYHFENAPLGDNIIIPVNFRSRKIEHEINTSFRLYFHGFINLYSLPWESSGIIMYL